MIDDFIAQRPLLFGIAYRMLGRVVEAEDMVQETWLRWQKQDRASIRSAKAWLTTAITRLCIDQRRAARGEREQYYGVWLPEPLVEAAATPPSGCEAIADSLTMAFMYMLERLSQDERAVFLLREVFEYDYGDIAAIVDTNETNCWQIFSRAKASLGRSTPAPAVRTSWAQQLVQQFLAACADGEVGNLLNLLADDAALYIDGGGRVTAAGRPIHTADHISRFFIGIRARRPPARGISPRAGKRTCRRADVRRGKTRAGVLVRLHERTSVTNLPRSQSRQTSPSVARDSRRSSVMSSLIIQAAKAERFRALQASVDAFVIPNPWDAVSTRMLASIEFEALAT